MADGDVFTFVQKRGATKQRTAFGVGGAVGAAIGATGATSEGVEDPGDLLGPSGLGHLAIVGDEIVLTKAKGGLKHKPTDEVLVRAPRDTVGAASLDGKLLMGILALDFVDGSHWEFDVPRQYKKSATQFAQTLGG